MLENHVDYPMDYLPDNRVIIPRVLRITPMTLESGHPHYFGSTGDRSWL